LTIDVDSTICETYGLKKQGAVFGYTHVRGLHPCSPWLRAPATCSGTPKRRQFPHGPGRGQLLGRVFGRVRKAGGSGSLSLRADSGFYNRGVTGACSQAGVAFSITAKMSPALGRAIEAVPEALWAPIAYWMDGAADVAETAYKPFGQADEVRLIVRRVKPPPVPSSPCSPITPTTPS